MCHHAGDALPVWGLMAFLALPDGSGRRGLKVFYNVANGKFMVRKPMPCLTEVNYSNKYYVQWRLFCTQQPAPTLKTAVFCSLQAQGA
jgi:hypothetical protein